MLGMAAPPNGPKSPGQSPWPVVTVETDSHCKPPPDCTKWKRARSLIHQQGCSSQPWAGLCERHLMLQLQGLTPCT